MKERTEHDNSHLAFLLFINFFTPFFPLNFPHLFLFCLNTDTFDLFFMFYPIFSFFAHLSTSLTVSLCVLSRVLHKQAFQCCLFELLHTVACFRAMSFWRNQTGCFILEHTKGYKFRFFTLQIFWSALEPYFDCDSHLPFCFYLRIFISEFN